MGRWLRIGTRPDRRDWRPGCRSREPGRRATRPRTGGSSRWRPAGPSVLESGDSLDGVTVAYETWGTLDEDASNAVLVCHALTGDTHAYDPHQSKRGWWQGVIGPGEAIDVNRYFVVCANVLGGCQGTTGTGLAEPGHRAPLGRGLPPRHHPGHGAGAGAPGGPPGREAVALRRRRLHGRDAGARVGRHVPGAGAIHRPPGRGVRGQPLADRLERGSVRAAIAPGSPLARRRVLRGAAGGGTPRGSGAGAGGGADHLPQRRVVRRALRAGR